MKDFDLSLIPCVEGSRIYFVEGLSSLEPALLKQLTRCGIFPNILYAYFSSESKTWFKLESSQSSSTDRYSINSIELFHGEVESPSLSLKELSFLRPLNLSIPATGQAYLGN